MAARHAELFTVSEASDLEELEQLLVADDVESVTIDIPEGATTLFNARDFRRIIEAARESSVVLSVTTDDPMRRELARIMGLCIEPSSGRVRASTVDEESVHNEPAQQLEGPLLPEIDIQEIEPDSMPANGSAQTAADADTVHAPLQAWESSDDSQNDDRFSNEDELSEASFSFVITPPIPRRAGLHTTDGVVAPADVIPDFEVWERRQEAPHYRPRPRRRAPRVITLLAVAATVMVLAALLLALILPTATIAVAPQVRQVEATLTYGLALPGTNYDISIPPQPITATLTYSGSVPATGARTEPDGTATGSILLTNPLTSTVPIAAGTVIVAASGMEFVVSEDVTVPAADPYGSLTFGSTTAGIRASAAGPGGNVDADAISGQLDSAVFFTNRDATGGGTTKTITTVSQADIDKLQQQAAADLDKQAGGAIASKITAGQQVVSDSEQRQPMQSTLDHAVGQDAQSVKIDASIQVTAQAYEPGALTSEARTAAAQKLTQQAGNDVELIADSVSVSEPQPIDGTNGTAFTVHATGSTQARIDADALDTLKAELAGNSTEQTLARIAQVPGVGSVSVQRQRTWLTSGMPRLASRITIEVQGAERISAQAASSRP